MLLFHWRYIWLGRPVFCTSPVTGWEIVSEIVYDVSTGTFNPTNAVVTCEIKLLQNYFSICRCPSEITLFQCAETCLTLFQQQ